MLPAARRVRPTILHEPRRELDVYRRILCRSEFGTPALYGMECDGDRAWLFLERVRGQELYQVGDVCVWQAVARWLAGFHERVGTGEAGGVPLLRYDERYFVRWARRAVRFSKPAARGRVRWLARRAERAAAELAALPRTLIHGQFYASNVLVCRKRGVLRVCPVDWETAGVGPALLDLAALVSGWDERTQRALCRAYQEAVPGWAAEFAAFDRALDLCRLHLAVQWLGWARNWSPPAGHARDWLGEAVKLAERLGM